MLRTTNLRASLLDTAKVCSGEGLDEGSFVPLMVLSIQVLVTACASIELLPTTPSTKSVRVAWSTSALVNDHGGADRAERSNWMKLFSVALLAGGDCTWRTPETPKLLPDVAWVYASSVSLAGTADAVGGRSSRTVLHATIESRSRAVSRAVLFMSSPFSVWSELSSCPSFGVSRADNTPGV